MKNIIIKIKYNNYELLEHNGFNVYDINDGIYLAYSLDNDLKEFKELEFLLNMKGIFISQKQNIIDIFSDIYRSIPLYYYTYNDEIYIFSDFISIKKYINLDEEIDEVGFWEYLLFGNGIYTRTIYKNIKQFTAAGKLSIENNSINFDYYWDFNIKKNEQYENLSEKEVIKLTKELLISTFRKEVDLDKEYTLGLSGGMDSRLTFALMKELDLLKNTSFFTYGYDERILESEIAKHLLKNENLHKWEFYKLNLKEYSDSKDLIEFTGSSVTSNHIHMYSFLKNKKSENLISTYYTDAVFGYATKISKQNDDINDVDYLNTLNSYSSMIPNNILEIIKDDVGYSLKNYNNASNYTSINEYKYIVERNPKFHMNLLFSQSQLTKNTYAPFANFQILKLMIELPFKYKFDKFLIRQVIKSIDYNLLNNVPDTSNQRVYFKKDFKNIINNLFNNPLAIKLLIIKIVNLILFKLTNGKIYIFDKYSTEIHSNILSNNFFNSELDGSVDYFIKKGFIKKDFKNTLIKIPAYGNQTGLRFFLIDCYNFIKSNKK